MMKNIIEQYFIKDKQSDRCICCVVNVNVNVNQHSFSQQFFDLIDSENLIQRPVVIVIDCSFPIVYHCRSSNHDIGAMLSAFIQQQSGQAPAANGGQVVPAANGNGGQLQAGNGGQAQDGNGGQVAGNGGQSGADGQMTAVIDTGRDVAPAPVQDVVSPPPPRTPEAPVRSRRSRPVDELLRTAASKSMAKARPPVPRNLFSAQPEISEPPNLTLTPLTPAPLGGNDGEADTGLDGIPVQPEEVRDDVVAPPPMQENARPFCAICLDVMNHEQEALQALPCGHCFHTVCMQNWRDRCPICRQHVQIDPWATPRDDSRDDDLSDDEPEVEVPAANGAEDELGFL